MRSRATNNVSFMPVPPWNCPRGGALLRRNIVPQVVLILLAKQYFTVNDILSDLHTIRY